MHVHAHLLLDLTWTFKITTMKKITLNLSLIVLVILCFSCTDDLNTEPEIQKSLNILLEENPQAIEGILAKLYGGLVLHGQGVPGSDDQISDIVADDPGQAVYCRILFNMQEMTSDIAKNRWGDGGLDPLTTASKWAPTNKFFGYMYNRIFYQVSQANNFILELGTVSAVNTDLYIAEARFLRALSYYHAMDLFGSVPIITETDGVGGPAKVESSRSDIFNFVINELETIEDTIPIDAPYGRVNRATVQMVLAKVYLNAEVYTGVADYVNALNYSEKVITESNFELDDNYQSIFQGDNYTSKEIIFPLISDRVNARSYGGATYLVNGSYSADTMPINDFGATNGWAGNRCTKAIYGLFGDLETTDDSRAIFWTDGHNFEMENYRTWTDGYPTTKFKNTFANGEEVLTEFSDTDFPMFRLADAYLMYAEANLRGGGGSASQSLIYINELRRRAYGNNSGDIIASELTLDFIIDERARELYYEAHRRQDLIRFKRFTGASYIWPWKGGAENGVGIPEHYNLFPKPLEALQANPNLKQNTGY